MNLDTQVDMVRNGLLNPCFRLSITEGVSQSLTTLDRKPQLTNLEGKGIY